MEYVQIDKETGSLFKNERDKKGLTLEEMEALTEQNGQRISKSTISSIETNNINYTTKEKIREILRALDSGKLRDYEFSIIPKRGASQITKKLTGKELLQEIKSDKGVEDSTGKIDRSIEGFTSSAPDKTTEFEFTEEVHNNPTLELIARIIFETPEEKRQLVENFFYGAAVLAESLTNNQNKDEDDE